MDQLALGADPPPPNAPPRGLLRHAGPRGGAANGDPTGVDRPARPTLGGWQTTSAPWPGTAGSTSTCTADLDADPVGQFRRWQGEITDAGVFEPSAMVLVTADGEGRPSARHVLLRGVDAEGFTFFTNYGSRKGRELAHNPNATLLFPWAELGRQVIVEGAVAATSRGFRPPTSPPASARASWRGRVRAEPAGRRPGHPRRQLSPRGGGRRVEAARSTARPSGAASSTSARRPSSSWQQRPSRRHDRFRYTRAPPAPGRSPASNPDRAFRCRAAPSLCTVSLGLGPGVCRGLGVWRQAPRPGPR